MLERLTDASRAVMACAAEEARAFGRELIGIEHLLVGLCCDEAEEAGSVLAALGLTAVGVRAWLRAHAGQGPGVTAAPVLSPAARRVLELSLRESLGRGHDGIGTAHVLLALTRFQEEQAQGPAPGSRAAQEPGQAADQLARLLGDSGVSLRALHVAAAALVNWDGPGQGFPYLGAEAGGLAPLPGLWQRWGQAGAIAAVYAVLVVLITATGLPGERAAAAVLAVAVPVLLLVLGRLLSSAAFRRRLARPGAERITAPRLASALAAAGLRKVTVACLPAGGLAGHSAGRAYRWGAAGAIVLRPELKQAHPDLARFVTGHEVAHLARNDSLAGTLGVACVVGIADTAVLANPAASWLVLVALLGLIASNWLRELACDRFAARAAGQPPAREYLAYLGRASDLQRRQARSGWLSRLRGWLTHPPVRLRQRLLTRTLARLGMSAVQHLGVPDPPAAVAAGS